MKNKLALLSVVLVLALSLCACKSSAGNPLAGTRWSDEGGDMEIEFGDTGRGTLTVLGLEFRIEYSVNGSELTVSTDDYSAALRGITEDTFALLGTNEFTIKGDLLYIGGVSLKRSGGSDG
ncbi:MAG: hypothetical protein ACI3W9_04275 [Eubacteriales bacterium]